MRDNISHKFLRLTLAFLLATCGLAQQSAPRAAANDEPSVERLRAHVGYLASDELEGRRTGTRGAVVAAEYIAKEFARYGLRSGAAILTAPNSSVAKLSYKLPFPYVAGVELGKRNAMSFTPRAESAPQNAHAAAVDLRLGEDWSPIAWSANAKVSSAPVVYVGYGITASELGRDDYANVDARGKIVLAFAGTPDGDNPHGQFARFEDLRFKAAAAREHGAVALLVITRETNFKDDRLTRLRMDENLAAAGDAGIPVALISRQVARRAIEAAATPLVTFENLEQSANAKFADAPAAVTKDGSAAQGAAGQPTPPRKNFSTLLKHIAFSLQTDIARREQPAYNVVGLLEGSDAKLKDEAIVFGAHYDHLGRGGEGSLAAREGDIHHGADDNASGVAGLLELARIFATAPVKPRRTIVFVAFSGEEEGLIGSSYYVKNPVVPLANTVAMINMDMIGRLKDERLIVGGVGTASEWKHIV
ncbi:MAG: M20/M25/M40 family metallo-hydrolase [Pyrinomonadaceae bacterium]